MITFTIRKDLFIVIDSRIRRQGGKFMEDRNLTDLHIHIIPCIDDGSQSEEMSEKMLSMLATQNITTVIATPHYRDSVPKERVLKAFEQLEKIAQSQTPSIRLYLGNEIFLSDGMIDEIREGKAFSLANSRYYLIEALPQTGYQRLYEGVQEVVALGYAPILAHMERYDCLSQRIDRVKELIEAGCYLQVNAETVMLPFYQAQYRFIRKLLKQDLIHFIATDAHNMNHRKPELLPAMKRCKKILTKDQVNRIFYQNPVKILENEFI